MAAIPLRRNRDFVRLQTGQFLSNAGSQATSIAYPLLALALTHSAVKAGLVSFARTAPIAVFAIPAGLAADRWNRRGLMIAADVLRAAAIGGPCGQPPRRQRPLLGAPVRCLRRGHRRHPLQRRPTGSVACRRAGRAAARGGGGAERPDGGRAHRRPTAGRRAVRSGTRPPVPGRRASPMPVRPCRCCSCASVSRRSASASRPRPAGVRRRASRSPGSSPSCARPPSSTAC